MCGGPNLIAVPTYRRSARCISGASGVKVKPVWPECIDPLVFFQPALHHRLLNGNGLLGLGGAG